MIIKLTNACQVLDYINEVIAAIKRGRKNNKYAGVANLIAILNESSEFLNGLQNGGFADELSREDRIKSMAKAFVTARGSVRWSDEDKCFVGKLKGICGDCCDGDNIQKVLDQLDKIAYDYAADVLDGMSFIDENGEVKYNSSL